MPAISTRTIPGLCILNEGIILGRASRPETMKQISAYAQSSSPPSVTDSSKSARNDCQHNLDICIAVAVTRRYLNTENYYSHAEGVRSFVLPASRHMELNRAERKGTRELSNQHREIGSGCGIGSWRSPGQQSRSLDPPTLLVHNTLMPFSCDKYHNLSYV